MGSGGFGGGSDPAQGADDADAPEKHQKKDEHKHPGDIHPATLLSQAQARKSGPGSLRPGFNTARPTPFQDLRQTNADFPVTARATISELIS
jgi:hypothetical protein